MDHQSYRESASVEVVVVETPSDLALEAAKFVAKHAKRAIDEAQRFTLAVSGGNTPLALFDQLSAAYADHIDWEKTHIFWVDERSVPPTHPDSNYGAAKRHLLDKVGLPTANIHRIQTERPPKSAAKLYSDDLRQFFGIDSGSMLRFDLVILGIGHDGHTASLFPNTSALSERFHVAVSNIVPSLDQTRVTLTFPVINAASCILVLVSGSSKSEIVRTTLTTSFQTSGLPMQMVQPINGQLKWLLDGEAAKLVDDVSL